MGFWDWLGLGGDTKPKITKEYYYQNIDQGKDLADILSKQAFIANHATPEGYNGFEDYMQNMASQSAKRGVLNNYLNDPRSYAETMMTQQGRNQAANLMSQYAATRRGMNQGLAQKALMNATNDAYMQSANQGMMGALAERNQKMQAVLQQQALNDEMTKYYMSMGYNKAEADRAAKIAQEQMRFEDYQNMRNVQAGMANQTNANRVGFVNNIIGGFFGAAGSAASAGIKG